MLLTYNEYNRDLGYVQGMSDLLAPIYAVEQDDAVAFWGFVGFMERMVRHALVQAQLPVPFRCGKDSSWPDSRSSRETSRIRSRLSMHTSLTNVFMICRRETFCATSQVCARNYSLSITLSSSWIPHFTCTCSQPIQQISSSSFVCCLSGTNENSNGRTSSAFGKHSGQTG